MTAFAGQVRPNEDADVSSEVPLTEPEIVTVLHVDGFTVRGGRGVVHFAGWQSVEPPSDSIPRERRIVIRFAMSEIEASLFRFALGRTFSEGH